MTKIRVLAARVSNWLMAFDPGLLRLRSALRILVTMLVSLGILAVLTHIVGQAVTVAMLGTLVSTVMAFISMIPGRRQQWITALLVLLLALGAATLGTLLVPYQLLGILGLIAILFVAVYLRRFGSPGMLLGMTPYQVYFTLITFGALQPASITFAQLPWLLITIVVGILCGFVINVYLLRDPPPVRLLRTLSRALLIRICALMDVLRAGMESRQGDGRLPRRLRHQFFLVSEAASIIGQQFARMGSETLLAGVDKDELARRLFDAELAAEGLVVPAMAVGSGSLKHSACN